MRRSFLTLVLVACVGLIPTVAFGDDAPSKRKPDAATAPRLETLLQAVLEGVDSTEVIISRVTIPPNTSLPRHWHPGEEFAYVLEGSAVLWQKGKEDIVCRAGDVVKVPLKQVHTAITKGEGVTLLVFRVHEQGRPERIPAGDD